MDRAFPCRPERGGDHMPTPTAGIHNSRQDENYSRSQGDHLARETCGLTCLPRAENYSISAVVDQDGREAARNAGQRIRLPPEHGRGRGGAHQRGQAGDEFGSLVYRREHFRFGCWSNAECCRINDQAPCHIRKPFMQFIQVYTGLAMHEIAHDGSLSVRESADPGWATQGRRDAENQEEWSVGDPGSRRLMRR